MTGEGVDSHFTQQEPEAGGINVGGLQRKN